MSKTLTDDHIGSVLSRRDLLRAAGGITFMALIPNGAGAFAAAIPGAEKRPLPEFTALPYLQPGPSSRLIEGQESLVVAWQTNGVPADFTLEFGKAEQRDKSAKVLESRRWSGDLSDGEQRTNHVALLEGLELGKRYQYRVRMNGETLLDGFFTTRKPRGSKIRFASFGDNSYGEIGDRAIAYQAFQAHPDFVMNTGDNVYEAGLDNEYARYFFPVYNADQAGPHIGAPLLRSVPFYTVIANHDVHGKDVNKHPVADFSKDADALAYFTNMHLPNNGLDATHKVPITGDDDRVKAFLSCAGDRFPRMANYSFDYGDAHFLCLDSNVYIDPTDSELQSWITKDLKSTDAPWKFVVYHHPAFNAGDEHYAEQHMRVLCPLFEKLGVDIVLHGHEHTYQRTRPLRFEPKDATTTGTIGSGHRLVPGTFTTDIKFDGATTTKPNGVIYITTGAGGKHLYDPGYTDDSTMWKHAEDDNVEYVAKFISDRHSLTVLDLDSKSISVHQVDEWGDVVDSFRVTKS